MADAAAIAEALKKRLLSYLTSALPAGNHASQIFLGQRLFEAWQKDLFKGPYFETIPPYQRQRSLCDRFDKAAEKSEDRTFAQRFRPKYSWADVDHKFIPARPLRDRIWRPDSSEAGLESSKTTQEEAWSRPLFTHQWEAFDRVVYGQKSIVVATGTGSGKTECFQLPILYSLLAEPEQIRARRGVRALLIYPLNALVEDQCARLRRLLFWVNLQFHEHGRREGRTQQITFGRYTGDTPLDERDFKRRESEESLRGFGELIYRKEMQESPPDILVTNFTMLEYMLLREDDNQLFKSPQLFSTLVLDEVHTYSGTQGMEVAMLLRRLRGFLEGKAGERLPIHCIGTSATLGGADPRKDASGFASTIFGVEIKAEDVIVGSRPNRVHPKWDPARWRGLIALASEKREALSALLSGQEAGASDETWDELGRALGVSPSHEHGAEPPASRLGAMLVESGLRDQLRSLIETEPGACIDLDSLADAIAGKTADPKTVTGLVLALAGCSTYNREPTLALRAHFFLNEAKDAQLCLNPSCAPAPGGADEWWRQLYVSHHNSCDKCGGRVYSLYLCRRCGFVYMEGWRAGKFLWPERNSAEDPNIYERWLFRPRNSDLSAAATEAGEARTLCLRCGRHFVGREYETFPATQESHGCGPDSLLDIWAWLPKHLAGGQMESCLFCDQHWMEGQEVITSPAPSTYAVSTLCLEELKRQFEAADSDSRIISFSDTRQEAAQLALRLQGTNRDFAFRQIVYRVLGDEACTTDLLLDELFRYSRAEMKLRRVMGPDPTKAPDNSALREQLATLLYREAVTAYLTLEAQGLVRVEYDESLLGAAREVSCRSKLLNRLTQEEMQQWFCFLLDWGLRFVRFAMGPDKWIGPSVNYEALKEWNVFPKAATLFRGEDQKTVGFLIRQKNKRNAAFNFATRLAQRLLGGAEGVDLDELHAAVRPFWDSVLASRRLWAVDLASAARPLLNTGGADPDRCQIQLNFSSLKWRRAGMDEPLFQCDRCGRVSFYSIRGVCPVRDCRGSLRPTTHQAIDGNRFSPVRHYRKLITSASVTPLRAEEHTAQISPVKRAEIERDFRRGGEDGVDVVCGSTTFELGIDLGSIHSVFMSNLPPRAANYRQRAGRAGRRPGTLPLVLNYVRQRPHDQYFWGNPRDFVAGELPVPQLSLSSKEVLLRHVHAIFVGRLLEIYRQEHPGAMGLTGPPAAAFVDLVLSGLIDTKIVRELRPPETLSIRLHHFLSAVGERAAGDECWKDLRNRLQALKATYLPLHAEDGCLDVLSDHGILPSYAFPIYVDELRLRECPSNLPPRLDLKLQRDRSIALREYCPGRTFVAGKCTIESQGLWDGYDPLGFAFCPTCSTVNFHSQAAATCSKCGTPVQKKRAVIPSGGFFGRIVHSASESKDRTPTEVTDVYFDPSEEDPRPQSRKVGTALTVALVDARSMLRSKMRIFSPRPAHEGLPMAVEKLSDAAVPHAKLAACLRRVARGEGNSYHLMHQFTTDILQIRFLDNGTGQLILQSPLFQDELHSAPSRSGWLHDSVWLTLATALRLAGCQRILDVDPQEIGVVVRPCYEAGVLGSREIILYDTTAGGAGYARQLGDRAAELFVAASARLRRCPNDCQDSCYACLREYRNQLFHSRLHRGRVSEGFATFVDANFSGETKTA